MPANPLSSLQSANMCLPLHHDLLFIAGPCSVENRQQLFATARQLAAIGAVSVLRAGVWKPRSRPGNFEGLGKEALPWLLEIKKETGLYTAVEVAKPEHAELCLEKHVDILWIGARTSVNPFMVQEIANAIKGSGIPVMIKNPVCPDLDLWIGAFERIMKAGTDKVIAIHRGFKTHQKSPYRNVPLWEIPMMFKKEFPGIPLLCDPSHIAGHREHIAEVAQKALTLEMNGLMLEVHHKPEDARTDPHQQITPEALCQMLKQLINNKTNNNTGQRLQYLRTMIDEKDHHILELLAERFSLAKEIGSIKKEMKIPVIQVERQQMIIADRLQKARNLNLDGSFVSNLLDLLHQEAVKAQQDVAMR